MNYVIGLDDAPRMNFLNWITSLVIFFALACHYFAKAHKQGK